MVTGPLEARFYSRIATELGRSELGTCFVTDSRQAALHLASQHEVFYIYDRRTREKGRQTRTDLQDTYGLAKIRSLYRSDQGFVQRLVRRTEQEWIHETLSTLGFWENLISEQGIDCVTTELGSELVRRTGVAAANRLGRHTMFVNPGLIPETFFITTNEMGFLDSLRMNFHSPDADGELERAKVYLQHVRTEGRMTIYVPYPRLNAHNLKRFVDSILADLLVEKRRNPNYFFDRTALNYLGRFLRSKWVSREYERPVHGEKYVFFPLHCPWDMQLTVRAPQFLDQTSVVKECHEALPQGYKLYVKEHPASIGGYGTGFIESIARLKNTTLISPYHDSHDLIRDSSAVVVINSTVGWEAILHGKGTVVLGSPLYGGLGLTYDVDDMSDLSSNIRKALGGGPGEYTILAAIAAMMKSTYPGSTIAFTEDQLRTALYETNVSNVVQALQKEIRS